MERAGKFSLENCSNRTFMELKLGSSLHSAARWDGSNRTFMELKLYTYKLLKISVLVLIVPLWNWNWAKHLVFLYLKVVLIVPLWNWNEEYEFKYSAVGGSNRTFMELKYV